MKKFTLTLTLLLFTGLTFSQTPSFQVEKKGNGKPLLFLPGFTSPGSVWQETIDHLDVEKERHLISYAGFNGIQPIDTPWYATIKKELLLYIEKENLTDLSIIGHSMGGNLAVEIAAAMPDRVDKLILVDAIPCMRALMMHGVPASQIQYNSPQNKQMLEMSDENFLNTASMMANNMTLNPDKVETLTKWSLEADRNTWVYGYMDLLKLDLREALKQVKANTIILGAAFPDPELIEDNLEKQYANLAVKTIQMANDSKHFIMFDQPQWFFEKVNAFLTK